MDVYDEFKKLDFSRNEAKTYLALLSMGEANLKMLEKKTALHRANLLDALKRLEERGALGIGLREKRKFYFAVDPKTVFERIKLETEETIARLSEETKQLQSRGELSQISIFHGKEGVKNILADELEVGKTINVVQSSKNVDQVSGSYLSISREKRWRKGMKMRIIYEKADGEHAKKAAQVPLTEARITEMGIGPVTIDSYGDRAVLIFGEEPTVIRIVNQDVAKAFLDLFEMIDGKAKQIK